MDLKETSLHQSELKFVGSIFFSLWKGWKAGGFEILHLQGKGSFELILFGVWQKCILYAIRI